MYVGFKLLFYLSENKMTKNKKNQKPLDVDINPDPDNALLEEVHNSSDFNIKNTKHSMLRQTCHVTKVYRKKRSC